MPALLDYDFVLKKEMPRPAKEITHRILFSASGNVCDAGHVQQSMKNQYGKLWETKATEVCQI